MCKVTGDNIFAKFAYNDFVLKIGIKNIRT